MELIPLSFKYVCQWCLKLDGSQSRPKRERRQKQSNDQAGCKQTSLLSKPLILKPEVSTHEMSSCYNPSLYGHTLVLQLRQVRYNPDSQKVGTLSKT